MKLLIGLVVVWLVGLPVVAMAACTTATIANPNGTITICLTCCGPTGACTTHCT